jgi:asparagine synthase (glutamine-hydrolysing)
MSTVFGILNVDRKPLLRKELELLGDATTFLAAEGTFLHVAHTVGMGYQPYRTHQRIELEMQPTLDPKGNMVVLDGRLDNYYELSKKLGLSDVETSDSQIVLTAFDRWGEQCFARLVGDWAFALWCQRDHSLYLARDHAGTRTLYVEETGERIIWSTHLETFFAGGQTRELDRAYAARHLASQPLRDLTPYKSIRAIPAAHYLKSNGGGISCRPHWDWMIRDRIHYSSTDTYDDQFRQLFAQAVSRRTAPGAGIVAELSGGMDSSSIVCMADHSHRRCHVDPSDDLLQTLSFFDDLEPDWNEKPYFTAVERTRGKAGIHIDVSQFVPSYEPVLLKEGPPLLPGIEKATLQLQAAVDDQLTDTYRVVLSGIGGDELLGGVPSGLPELADLLVAGKIMSLGRRALSWSLVDRSPILRTVCDTARFASRLYLTDSLKQAVPEWLSPDLPPLWKDTRFLRLEFSRRLKLAPSSIDNGFTWWAVLEALPHLYPSYGARREYRYPYLDRDLVDFLLRVPRDVLVKSGRRRTMMRRALKDIVPREILERKRKAYVVRRHLSSLTDQCEKIQDLFSKSRLADYGLILPAKFRQTLQAVAAGQQLHLWPSLMRSISFELWLQSRPSVLA